MAGFSSSYTLERAQPTLVGDTVAKAAGTGTTGEGLKLGELAAAGELAGVGKLAAEGTPKLWVTMILAPSRTEAGSRARKVGVMERGFAATAEELWCMRTSRRRVAECCCRLTLLQLIPHCGRTCNIGYQ